MGVRFSAAREIPRCTTTSPIEFKGSEVERLRDETPTVVASPNLRDQIESFEYLLLEAEENPGVKAFRDGVEAKDAVDKCLETVADIRDGNLKSDAEMVQRAMRNGLTSRNDVFYTPFGGEDKTVDPVPGAIVKTEEGKALLAEMGFTNVTSNQIVSSVSSEETTFLHFPFNRSFAATLKENLSQLSEEKKHELVDLIPEDNAWKAAHAGLPWEDAFNDLVKMHPWSFESHSKNFMPKAKATATEASVFVRFTAIFKVLGIYDLLVDLDLYEQIDEEGRYAANACHFKHHIMQPHIPIGAGGYKVNEDFDGLKKGWSVYVGSTPPAEKVKFAFRTTESVEALVAAGVQTEVGLLFSMPAAPLSEGFMKNTLTPEEFGDSAKHEAIKTAYYRFAHFKF